MENIYLLIPMDAYSLDLHLKNVFDLLETVLSYLNYLSGS